MPSSPSLSGGLSYLRSISHICTVPCWLPHSVPWSFLWFCCSSQLPKPVTAHSIPKWVTPASIRGSDTAGWVERLQKKTDGKLYENRLSIFCHFLRPKAQSYRGSSFTSLWCCLLTDSRLITLEFCGNVMVIVLEVILGFDHFLRFDSWIIRSCLCK